VAQNNYATQWQQAAPLPSSISGQVRAFLRNSILSIASAASKGQDNTYLRCLYCHHVFDDQRDDFEKLIVQIRKLGEFVGTDECIQMLTGKKDIDRRYFHLSFDDGFRNNFTNAYPILKKHGVPAIFFVPSSLIEADWHNTRNYGLNIVQYRAVIEIMRWKDLHDLILDGYEVGSHTRTHARLSEISNSHDLMEDEIVGSKKELETNLNYECKYISWPFGKLTDADSKSLKMVEDAGYAACFGAYRGTVQPGSTNRFSIPRHHFEAQWPISHIEYFARGNMEVKR
jgi:peptidoglycan/xylan/chitin deacetylase (PgdA/CDA1 family)